MSSIKIRPYDFIEWSVGIGLLFRVGVWNMCVCLHVCGCVCVRVGAIMSECVRALNDGRWGDHE